MSIVVYQCDTCKRSIQVVRNIEGLDVLGTCVITLGCRGHLTQTSLKQDFTIPVPPVNVAGLTNWVQRKVLFNFTQSIASETWVINHNLGVDPVVEAFINTPTSENPEATTQVVPDVVVVNADTIKLIFSMPQSGIAQLIARTSDPTLLQEAPAITDTPPSITTPPPITSTTPVQLDAHGYFVLATDAAKFGMNMNMNVAIEFTSSSGQSTIITYTSTTSLDTHVAWQEATHVVIKGKLYILREFFGISSAITSGEILNGTPFRFMGINTTTGPGVNFIVDPVDQVSPALPFIDKGDIFILLSQSPFASVDINTTQVSDISAVTTTNNVGAMFYFANTDFFASSSVIETIYPPIRILS